MEWRDTAWVLSTKKHAEAGAVVTLLTRDQGRHAGLVRNAASPRMRGVLQPGNRVTAAWRARLADHLGTFQIELDSAYAVDLFDDPLRLAGLSAACAVADGGLPEREPHPRVYEGFSALMDALANPELGELWIAAYVHWELGVLSDLGYGLDLDRCAATGANDDLAYVSPRTGRAVSLSAGEPYRDKLLALPDFLVGRGGGDAADLGLGLALTGHFLERHLFNAYGREIPPARTRFIERVSHLDTISRGGSADDHDISGA